MNLVDLLVQTKLFRGMPVNVMESMARRMTMVDYQKGDTLVAAGECCEHLILVADGAVQLLLPDKDTGLEFTVGAVQSGEFFGAAEVLTGDPMTQTARAAAPTRTFQLAYPLVRQLFKVPEVGALFATHLAREVRIERDQSGFRFMDLSKQPYRPEIVQLIPARILARNRAIPLKTQGDRLLVAMVDPTDRAAVDDLQRAARGYTVEPAGVTEAAYKQFRHEHLRNIFKSADVKTKGAKGASGVVTSIEYLGVENQQEPARATPIIGQEVVRMVSQIFLDGLNRQCSDIHIEPSADRLQVRYRLEGLLTKVGPHLSMDYHAAITTRIKVLAKLDIAEKRLPQEGRFTVRADKRRMDFRVSIIPTKAGEKVVLRVLDPSNLLGKLDKIIYHEPTMQLVRDMVLQPYGIVFLTGPTGSGKSTSLYCLLNERTNESVNVVTVEDPIEYDVPDIIQTQVNENIGLGFHTLLRAFLRQDPDVILVGEIRDRVTAKTALEAALAGRFVMTSLHTNSAAGTIFRLKDMGMDPFLIANAMLGVIGQRLVRRICPGCKTQMEGRHVLLDRFNSLIGALEPLTTTYFGAGCSACNRTGYNGRLAALEVMRVNEEIRTLIMRQASEKELTEEALRYGMVPFTNYCRFLVSKGFTTVEEAMAILQQAE